MTATKSAYAAELAAVMERDGVSRAELARRMHTSRSTVGRVLDPADEAVTVSTLSRAAASLRRASAGLPLASGSSVRSSGGRRRALYCAKRAPSAPDLKRPMVISRAFKSAIARQARHRRGGYRGPTSSPGRISAGLRE